MNERFDRDLSLVELLPAADLANLGKALSHLLGSQVAILDAGGNTLWGSLAENASRGPLVIELEPLGHLAAPVPPESLAAAVALLRHVLKARARYLAAASLHKEAVAADYAALVEKHAALQASEARYKALSEQLEARVQEQLATLEERQSQLFQAERLASVGQLAAGVAHEINNPLGFIRSNLNTLADYLGRLEKFRAAMPGVPAAWKGLDIDFALEDGRELIGECISGTDRISRIIRDLREFSSIDRHNEETVDLNDNLRATAAMIEVQKPPGVAVELDLKPLPLCRCLPGHLNQVFLGVASNALQALGDSGCIRIASDAGDGTVVVTIADDGVGIPAEDLSRVFDPFFTTRTVGHGTGLGLSVAHDIVVAHGGTIALTSQPGQGTTVTIAIPL